MNLIYNYIVVFNKTKDRVLFCKRQKDPTDRDRFAGEQNIAHIMNVALKYPIPEKRLSA